MGKEIKLFLLAVDIKSCIKGCKIHKRTIRASKQIKQGC